METFGRFGLDQSVNRRAYEQRIESYPPNAGWTGTESFYDQWYNCFD